MSKLTHDTFIRPACRGRGIPFTRASTFCKGLDGSESLANEDRVLVLPTENGTLLAAIDGVTPRTAWKMPHPTDDEGRVSTGWMGAYVVEQHLRALKPDMTMGQLMADIHADWQMMLRDYAVPKDEIMGAVFVVYVPWEGEHGEIWRFGDPLWNYQTQDDAWASLTRTSGDGTTTDSRTRVEAIRQAMAEQGVRDGGIPHLPGRQLGHLARTGREAMNRRRLAAGGESWLNRLDGMMDFVHEPVTIPAGTKRMVLATDGVLVAPQGISGALTFLRHLREKDPLMLGINPDGLQSPKGFVDFDGTVRPYTDDVGIVEVWV